jgi:hypothetical protein
MLKIINRFVIIEIFLYSLHKTLEKWHFLTGLHYCKVAFLIGEKALFRITEHEWIKERCLSQVSFYSFNSNAGELDGGFQATSR